MSLSEWLLKEIRTCETRTNFMIQYSQLKLAEEDYHGVADAAMDIREIQARKHALEEVLSVISEQKPNP